VKTLEAHLAATPTTAHPIHTPVALMATDTPGPAVTQLSPDTTDLHLESGLVIDAPSNTQALLQKGTQIQILESLATEQYDPKTLSLAGHTYTYTIKLNQEQSFLWGSNWCATTDQIRQDNFNHITFEFSVDDTPVPVTQFLIWEGQLNNQSCRFYYTVVRNWPTGATHLQIKVTFDQLINDGTSDFPAGTHYYRYTVTRP